MKALKTIIALIVLSCSLHFQIQAFENGTSEDRQAVNKLKGPLRDVVELYRTKSKISENDFTNHLTKKRNRLAVEVKLPVNNVLFRTGKSVAHKNFPVKQRNAVASQAQKRDGRGESVLSSIILPEVQKRWNNPPYDVIRCNVVLSGSVNILKNYNAKIRSVVTEDSGRKIASVEIAGTDIEKMAEHSAVEVVSPVLKKGLDNDQGAWATGAKRLRIGSNGVYTKGYTGKGVIVGVIDSGIDWTHEDFIDPKTGKTRILFLWDTEVDTPGKTPAALIGGDLAGLNYGTLWTKEEIDAGLCTSTDTNGHGTHVCGSAAGNGAATGKYTGMAPNADIVFVKGLNNDGIPFIYEVARRENKPCTLNMSYGPSKPIQYTAYWPENYPADGSSEDARKIKELNEKYGNGFIPVKSAGNTGHWPTYSNSAGFPYFEGGYHSGGSLAATTEHSLLVPDYRDVWADLGWGAPAANDYPRINIGMWYDRPIQVTFISPNGDVIGPMVHGNAGVDADFVNRSGAVYYTMNYAAASNGSYYAKFNFGDYFLVRYYPVYGKWTIKVEPIGVTKGYVDMWCGEMDVYNGTSYWMSEIHCKFLSEDAHRQYIRDEAASEYMITVGNYTTKTKWNSIKGGSYNWTRLDHEYSLCSSSSPGPARDRFMKPDIAAPGNVIVSTASKDAAYYDSQVYLDPDGRHGAMSGTSMASPHVAGGIAMILEKYPDMNVDSMRNLIQKWARTDGITNSIGPDGFGKGIFRVSQLNEKPVAKISCDKMEVILDNGEFDVNFDGASSYDPEGFPLTYRFTIESTPLNGAKSAVYDFRTEGSKSVLKVDGENEATYTVRLVVNDTIEDSRVECKATVEAKFYPVYPPSNLKLARLENDLIFQKEYINRLSWEHNPANKSKLKNYVVYRKVKGAADSTYAVVATLGTDVLTWDDRNLKNSDVFTYRVVTVNYRDKVSDPVVVGN